jgi:AraC-like DNA-binding protein
VLGQHDDGSSKDVSWEFANLGRFAVQYRAVYRDHPAQPWTAEGRPGMDQVVEATDLETAHHLLSSAYGSMRLDWRGRRHGMRLAQAWLGPIRFDHITFRMDFDASVAPLGALVFGQLKSGAVSYASAGSERVLRPGAVFFAVQPDHPYTARVRDTEVELAIIDPSLLNQVAATAPGRPIAPVRLLDYQPISDPAAAHWRRTYAYLRDDILAKPEANQQPLLAAAAGRLLAATILASFPNTALTDPTSSDHHDANTATLRRAVAFIEANADQDLCAADIAAAASVTIRAVQLAFRRHLDITPMAYLRRVRLECAHRQLCDADPTRDTVTGIAARWGFANPSRFTAHYRATYRVLPSHTLNNR